MNEFTLMVINKGWTVKEACQHWNIDYKTWQRMRARGKDTNKLLCMIRGLEQREFVFGESTIEQIGDAFERGQKNGF